MDTGSTNRPPAEANNYWLYRDNHCRYQPESSAQDEVVESTGSFKIKKRLLRSIIINFESCEATKFLTCNLQDSIDFFNQTAQICRNGKVCSCG